jgi:sulfonate transport system permease protein
MSDQRWSRVNVSGIAVVCAVLAVWEVTVRAGILAFDYLPAPSRVAIAIKDMAFGGELFGPLAHTVGVVIGAWVMAMVVGVSLGAAIGLSHRLQRFTMASVEVLRTLPIVALVPVALLVLGVGVRAELVVAAYAATWPVVVSTIAGVNAVPVRQLEVCSQLQLSRIDAIRKVIMPSAFPVVLAGARLALGISLVVVVLAELIGNPAGLGNGISEMQFALQPERMWGYVMVVSLLGAALNAVLVGSARAALGHLLPRGA